MSTSTTVVTQPDLRGLSPRVSESIAVAQVVCVVLQQLKQHYHKILICVCVCDAGAAILGQCDIGHCRFDQHILQLCYDLRGVSGSEV